MVMARPFFNILLYMVLLTAPSLALAVEPLQPLHFKGIYEFGFNGVRIGRMGVEIAQSPTDYNMTADVTTSGVLKLFVQHSSHTTVEGTGAEFAYPNRNYESNYQTKKKKKHVKMVVRDGQVEETLVPPDSKRPAVSPELKNSALDPLSIILAIRQKLAGGNQSFKLNVYDGRRLTAASFVVKGKRSIPYGNRPMEVTQVNVRRELVAGFTDSELAKHNSNEPAVQMYFPVGQWRMPVRLETRIAFGTVSATLIKECRTGESCLLGNRD